MYAEFFVCSSIWNNTNFISYYVKTLRIGYILKYHYSAMTSPHNTLFICNRNSRSSAALTVGIEFSSPWFCFTLCRTLGNHSAPLFGRICVIVSCIDRSKLLWIQTLSDSLTYLCSVFYLYFLVKGSITKYCLTYNSCSCFKIDSKSF